MKVFIISIDIFVEFQPWYVEAEMVLKHLMHKTERKTGGGGAVLISLSF